MNSKNDPKAPKQMSTEPARAQIEVREPAKKTLVVSEFDRAPLTDVNFGF